VSANETWYVDVEVAVVETIEVQAIDADEASRKAFRDYPGPVQRVLRVRNAAEWDSQDKG
jgi:hypothetical protein